MNAVFLVLFAGACFFLGYRLYSYYLAREIYRLDDSIRTPAHEQEDGVDYVPTRAPVLFGHHFASIAGAAPIVGPAIAVTWGWLPALLWVVLGTVFIGAVHDFGCLVISAKNKGVSIAEIAKGVVSPRARFLFMLIVLFLAWIVLAVFAFVIAKLFVDYPGTVFPINFQILVAVAIGFFIYRGKGKLLVPSLIALALLYLAIPIGVRFPMGGYSLFLQKETRMQVEKDVQEGKIGKNSAEARQKNIPSTASPLELAAYYEQQAKERGKASLVEAAKDIRAAREKAIQMWIYFLLFYSFCASVLPVWLLLQPRDYINSHQLLTALGVLYFALLWARPELKAPALHLHLADGPPWFPFLFITIACGAISGFHGLVSSGTTSKQLDRMRDARPIGYGGMLGEGTLGLLSVIACTAGVASADQWLKHYHTWSSAKGKEIDAFVQGCSYLLRPLGVPEELAVTFVGLLVIAFSATTLDTAARIQRYIIEELAAGLNLKPLTNRYVAGLLACATPILLLIGASWKKLWPVFGATNQMLAALSLSVLTVYLVRKRIPAWPVALPMVFLTLMTASGLAVQVKDFYQEGNLFLCVVALLLLGLSLAVVGEGLWTLRLVCRGKVGEMQVR